MLDQIQRKDTEQGHSHQDQRRKQLIDATIKTISAHGLSKTTVSRVTKAANLSAGTIGFYFKSKEQLLLGTLESLNRELTEQIQLLFEFESEPLEALKAVIEAYFDPAICDIDKIAVWYAFASESSARREYMSICGDHDAWFHRTLLEQVRKLGQPAGMPERKAVAIARGLEGLIDGFWQEFLFQPEEFDSENAKQVCFDYLDTVLPVSADGQKFSAEISSISTDKTDVGETCDLMPTWTYYDQEFLDLEISEIFRKHWLVVGHQSDMPDIGDYLTLDTVGEQIVVIRGEDGLPRAFHNVCRHRGARVLEEDSGNCPHAITCPFHGWTYHLDGQLIGVPAENTFENLEKSKIALLPVETEIWHGFIFIRLEPGGKSVAEQMSPLEDMIVPYQIENMQPVKDSSFYQVRPYNWKVIHDIDNEGYHVPVGHPSLHQLFGNSYSDTTKNNISISTSTISEKPAKLWSVRNYQKLLPEFDHLPDAYQRMWNYVQVFPTMTIGLYPDSIEYYMTLPVKPDLTIYRGASYALPDSRRGIEAVRYLNRRINFTTDEEDESYVRDMQVGRHSTAFPEQRLSTLESGVREYHHKLQAILPVAKQKNHPGVGKLATINESMHVGN